MRDERSTYRLFACKLRNLPGPGGPFSEDPDRAVGRQVQCGRLLEGLLLRCDLTAPRSEGKVHERFPVLEGSRSTRDCVQEIAGVRHKACDCRCSIESPLLMMKSGSNY